jgi:hypothetical protein
VNEPAAGPVEPDQTRDPTARLAAVMRPLDGLEHRPPSEHVAAFERVHQALTDALSAIDGV